MVNLGTLPRSHHLDTLISTDLLARRLADPGWVVFDCRFDLADTGRGRGEYARSHIPGARYLHLDDDLSAPKTGSNGRHPLPSQEKFASLMGTAGVSRDKRVVAYDAQGGMVAVRLWWMLRWLGHEQVAVLDGGWDQWVAEGSPQTAEVPQPQPGTFPVRRGAAAVDAQFVLEHIGDPQVFLLDARAPDRYRGQNETLDPVAGRIPGAHNRFFRENLGADGCFKPSDRLRAEFGKILGPAAPERVVHYCGSGVSACHNLLAMELAGLGGARLYPGSWSEWCADRSRPAAAGEPAPEETARPAKPG